MRTGKVKIAGHEYVLCFSARVIRNVEEAGYESVEAYMNDGSRQTSHILQLLAWMIDAGDRWETLEGRESPGTITFDDLIDTVGVDDFAELTVAITGAMTGERHVEADPPKKPRAAGVKGARAG